MADARIIRLVAPDRPDEPTFQIDGDVAGTRRRTGRFPSYEAAVVAAENAGLELLYGWTDEIALTPAQGGA